MYSKVLLGASMLAVLAGCPGTFNGTVGGIGLAPADTIVYPEKDTNSKTVGLFVMMADKGGLCNTLKANRMPKSATGMMLTLFNVSEKLELLAPDVGEYTVVQGAQSKAGRYAWASFNRTDANCTDTLSSSTGSGKSGLVKITALNASTNGNGSGSFDITFGTDHVTGTFSGSYCDMAKIPNNPSCE